MKAKFTGHDTFPLRYGWLYKAINHLKYKENSKKSEDESIYAAIVELGVGKNMVKAIQYWAEASNVVSVERVDGQLLHNVTKKGKYLFGDGGDNKGQDPYLEQPGSIWLLHFWLNFNDEILTSYRYFFNYANFQYFEKQKLIDDCFDDARRLVKSEPSNISTIKKDVDCFLSMYSKKLKSQTKKVDEEHFTSPLAELNLIEDNGRSFYISNLAERPEIPIQIFVYTLIEFFKVETKDSNVNTIDFDSLLSKPCSPGRIFRLSEAGLGQLLDEVENYTNRSISWVDSLGLRQVNISEKAKMNSYDYLNDYYGKKNA